MIFQVETKDESPSWLYTQKGVPKVYEYSDSTYSDTTGWSPFYADSTYQYYFNRMTDDVANMIKVGLSFTHRKWIVGILGSYGNPGDYLSYRGIVDSQYNITDSEFFVLWKKFSLHTYKAYDTSTILNQIKLISNPSNNNQEHTTWVVDSCPHGWLKMPTLGKGFQLNDELDKASWLMDILNKKTNNRFIRGFSELSNDDISYGGWSKHFPRNVFALMCSMIYWGMDISGQTPGTLRDSSFVDTAFRFYNRYAGQKDTVNATNAMCMLRDGLDASDTVRFPILTYGSANRGNVTRYKNIVNVFASRGAKLEDTVAAISTSERGNLQATGTNDAGWRIFRGNYERYIHLMDTTTTLGYWNVDAASDTKAIYGRFARGFDMPTNRKVMYFNIDNTFFNNSPLNGSYPVCISVTHLDKGGGGFTIYYDAISSTDKVAKSITCNNTLKWITDTVMLADAYFGNRASHSSDFYIKSNNNSSTDPSKNIIFSHVELAKMPASGMRHANNTKNVEAISPITLLVQPNPSHGLTHVTFKVERNITCILTLADMNGKILLQQKSTGTGKDEQTSINVTNIISGMYTLTITDEKNNKKTISFLKD